MLLDIPATLQTSTHVLTGRVAELSRKSNMDICSNPTGSGVNHVAIDLTLFLCACYIADMLPTYPYATCRLDIVSTLADTIFGRVANMAADMSATCFSMCLLYCRHVANISVRDITARHCQYLGRHHFWSCRQHVGRHVGDMSADTHVSVDSTIFLTFENPTFPAKFPTKISVSLYPSPPFWFGERRSLTKNLSDYLSIIIQ
jgi:hypothetical protein